jgi:hypothetical protein
MTSEEQVGVRRLESPEEFDEARLEAVGFVFHGAVLFANGDGDGSARRSAVKAGSNLLHFARCAKLDKAGEGEVKIWFRTIGIAKAYLDEAVGSQRWKWCKVCEREITQRILNER